MSFGIVFLTLNAIVFYFLQRILRNKILFPRLVRQTLVFLYTLYILSFVIVECYILARGYENSTIQLEEVDYMLVLGAGLKGEEPSLTLRGRLDTAITYLNNHKDLPVIVSGGQGSGEAITEAEAMARYLTSNGINYERILLEDKATSTIENITYSKDLLQKKGYDNPTLLIVTSDYHIARSEMIAEKLGLTSYSLAGDSPFFVKVNYFIREYVGMIITWYELNLK